MDLGAALLVLLLLVARRLCGRAPVQSGGGGLAALQRLQNTLAGQEALEG